MKLTKILGFTALAVLAFGQARAQVEVTSGELRLGHERFLDDVVVNGDEEVLSRTSLEGALEIGIGYSGLGAQFDLGLDRAGLLDDTGVNATVHGLYSLPDGVTLGVFAGHDGFGSLDSTHYGIEGAFDTGLISGEGYLMGLADDVSGSAFGIQGGYRVLPSLQVGARLDRANLDDGADASRFGLTADYDVTESFSIGAELGVADGDLPGIGSADEGYIGVQATVGFGDKGGSSFDRRGLLDILPGF
ncbi:hypothetical protein PARPLA_02658 [Rhodobacteraceae bacterium THAF1]|uniref:hypothetical protein n=1 Tax=Palleronia sp. THAF1 TaxID=2587842 RepID=UPI000F3C62E6|nr:hypothetical protein [Palleronia sp. THAF1]QFU08651.1 hypothetical protein FIU81_08190 [Palleronia sp. THAF1]VDC28397.1 hypothetical protein PARPLA_02658 [Rhodobacteraceae bacterium THAF1]